MKKKLLALFLMLAIAVSFTSCFGGKVSKVRIEGDGSYEAVYLYYFENAVVSEYKKYSDDEGEPTKSGYIYSTKKYSEDDKITVWSEYHFSSDSSWVGYTTGTTAIVKKVVKVYYVDVSSSFGRYKITYYTVPEKYCKTEKSDLDDLEKNMVNAPKDSVYITYDTK